MTVTACQNRKASHYKSKGIILSVIFPFFSAFYDNSHKSLVGAQVQKYISKFHRSLY